MILASLAVFSALSLNLILQFVLGAGGAVFPVKTSRGYLLPVFQMVCLFVSVFLLWTAYYYILKPFSGGFLEYFLLFPLSALVCLGLETLWKKFSPKQEGVRSFSALTAYDGLVLVSLILTIHLALNPWDAFILSFFFALGCLLVLLILEKIRRRSVLERVPGPLQGGPLVLISMGLLSMIFAAVAWICFQVLENL
jgi:Na+-translocating ferredoxin:NAD+ oxidoreductase RnfA subunit